MFLTNNISFKATLDTTDLKFNKKRWNNINEEFSKITTDSQKDVFVLSNDKQLEIYLDTRHDIGEARLSKAGTKNLMSLPDKEIAKQLKKVLNIFSNEETTYNLAEKFTKAIGKKGDFIPLKNFDEETFWNIVVDKALEDKKDAIQNDEFLSSNFEFI